MTSPVWILRAKGVHVANCLCDGANLYPQTRCSCFFEFTINVHGNTRHSENGIPDQTDGIYTLFQTKMAKSIPYFRLEMLENDTLWGGTYPYGLYTGESAPPPPPDPYSGEDFFVLTHKLNGDAFYECSHMSLRRYKMPRIFNIFRSAK